jgi:predicted rRNA methylase YqxC with S4 and FtsJ domains
VAWPTQNNAQFNARDKVFAALDKAKERNIVFTEVELRISEGNAFGQFAIAGQDLSAEQVTQALQNLVQNFHPTTAVTMGFRAQFQSGQDLKDFAQAFDFNYTGQWRAT